MLRIEDFVDAGLYHSPKEVIRDALRSLTQVHPEYRITIAAARYKRGEISLTKAAQLAGVSGEQMKDALIARGMTPAVGSGSVDEAHDEVEALRRHLSASGR